MGFCKVVEIDETKCVNCFSCISQCPVKYCFTVDKNSTKINPDLCIGCGKCLSVCKNNAIYFIDDFDEFVRSINKGIKSCIIVSPAASIVFKNHFKQLIRWLKESFVLTGVYNEALGAEIAVAQYIHYIKKSSNIPVISQQCPSIVDFIKIYKPKLIDYLPPVHSPVIIMAKIIREKLKFEGNIAYIGSCISKRREFRDPDTDGLVQYNITLANLMKYIELHKVDLSSYKEQNFDLIPAERGNVFCGPAGFKNIANRSYDNANIEYLEGNILYSKFFNDIEKGINNKFKGFPIIYDVINCENGCFRGPGQVENLSFEEIFWRIKNYEEEGINHYKTPLKAQKAIDKFIEDNNEINFERIYFSDTARPLYTLTKVEIEDTINQTNKKTDKDFLNCQSCGYGNCLEFHTALKYKLNVNSNCRFYQESILKTHHDNNIETERDISNIIDELKIANNQMVSLVLEAKKSFEIILKFIDEIIKANDENRERAEEFSPIVSAITEISQQINLLSLNAAIEASRAGEMGKGFAVVASEIRKLADKTKDETEKIVPIVQAITSDIITSIKIMDNLKKNAKNYETITSKLNDVIPAIDKYVKGLTHIAERLESLKH